jgi:hypothetical protein
MFVEGAHINAAVPAALALLARGLTDMNEEAFDFRAGVSSFDWACRRS